MNENVKSWMKKNIDNYVDKYGDINITQLAEDCAIELFDRNAEDDEFFAAFEAGESYEVQ
jgi:hypothetical protein